MDTKDSTLDNFSDGEYTDIRRKLRLSSWWKVTSVSTERNLPEYGEYDDGPGGPSSGSEA